MRIKLIKVGNLVTLILLISCFLWSCGDQKEQSKAPVISKKISAPSKPEPPKTSNDQQTDASTKKPEIADTEKEEASVEKRIYDPKERINPFTPLFREDKQKEVVADQVKKRKRKKRIPQTPLEKISLNQLKLVAVIRTSSENKALVEDNNGKGFIIKNGTYIGLNSGIVTQINSSSIVVEEEIENLLGEYVLQNTEIKLQKPAGD